MGVMEFLNEQFPPNNGKKLYKVFQIKYTPGGVSKGTHVVAIARPFGTDNEFHMFDPNIGWYVGDKPGCAAWLQVQFSTNMSSENGWGQIYMLTLEYTASNEDAAGKHYVQYQATGKSIEIGEESSAKDESIWV